MKRLINQILIMKFLRDIGGKSKNDLNEFLNNFTHTNYEIDTFNESPYIDIDSLSEQLYHTQRSFQFWVWIYRVQVLELMQMHPKERLRRVILIASRYSTGLKLENYYFFTFTFSWPEVGKLFHIYFFFTFSFSWPEVGKLFHIYFFTFSQTEVGKLFRSYVFTFSRPEVGKLFHISMAKCKTAVTPLLIHWSYCSLALSHQNME